MPKNDLELRTKKFALDVITLVSGLPPSRAGDALGRQLLRSAMSIGANYREANRAESRDDFIHKVGIATKEAAETEFWLELLEESPQFHGTNAKLLLIESREILAILVTIGKNAKANRP